VHAFVHRDRLRAASTSLLLFLAAMISIASDCRAIESRSQWDEAFRLAHPAQDPCLADPGEYPGDLYAWHGHYWIRAYLSMADTYGDTKYLDKAVALIDRMLFYRDDARHSRGELDPRAGGGGGGGGGPPPMQMKSPRPDRFAIRPPPQAGEV
jgi:hypothetical protein